MPCLSTLRASVVNFLALRAALIRASALEDVGPRVRPGAAIFEARQSCKVMR
jgi:hypothetical protein